MAEAICRDWEDPATGDYLVNPCEDSDGKLRLCGLLTPEDAARECCFDRWFQAAGQACTGLTCMHRQHIAPFLPCLLDLHALAAPGRHFCVVARGC